MTINSEGRELILEVTCTEAIQLIQLLSKGLLNTDRTMFSERQEVVVIVKSDKETYEKP